MSDEFAVRQCAITLRLNGRSVKYVCSALGRSEFWFYNGDSGRLAVGTTFPLGVAHYLMCRRQARLLIQESQSGREGLRLVNR